MSLTLAQITEKLRELKVVPVIALDRAGCRREKQWG